MSLSALIDPAFSSRLCLTLLHSMWHVALVTSVAVLVDRTWRKPSASRSYAVHLTALMTALVALPVTWFVVDASEAKNMSPSTSTNATSLEVPSGTAAQAMMPAEVPEVAVEPVVILPQQLPDLQKAETPTPASAFSPTVAVATSSADWQKYATWIAVLYVIGVISMLSRLAVAMRKAHQLAESARPIRNAALLSLVDGLARRWSMTIVPVLAEAERIFVPQVVGLLRPTILLPAAAINGLSVDELEMILTHEVAHIRRYDMWAALIQRLAESLLFFNPAIWYLNRRISELREYCCDDIACQAQTIVDPPPHVRYAQALLRVVELGQPNAAASPHLATLAASGRSPSELRRRVTRLFGEPIREPFRLSRGALLTCAGVAFGIVCGPALWQSSSSNSAASGLAAAQENASEKSTSEETMSDELAGKFKVIAIGSEEAAEWWKADGAISESVPFSWTSTQDASQNSGSTRQRRIVISTDGLPDNAEITWSIPGALSWTGGSIEKRDERDASNYLARHFAMPMDRATFGLKIGIATGPWKVTAASRQTSDTRGGSSETVIFSGLIDRPNAVTVFVSHNIFDRNIRLVAIDKQGKEHLTPDRGGVSSGKIYQMSASFQNLQSAQIERVELQTRQYSWLNINELPIQPKPLNKAADVSVREFRLNIVGPDGTPVANASLEIRGNHAIKAEHVQQGAFVKQGPYGVYVNADEQGTVVVKWSPTSGPVAFSIKQTGYGPYWAAWNPLEVPDEFTAELDAAWSVGGIVVDEAGKPIAGAEVNPSVEFKKPPGDTSQLGVGASVNTDADGKWSFNMVPVSTEKDYVFVAIDHPQHQPQRLSMLRSEYEVKGDASPSRTIVLKAGVMITGKVIDNSGNPIEGATVRTKFVNEVREAKTDAAGTYAIGGCEPRLTRIVAFAKGRAVELQEVLVDPGMKPVDFTLKPGGHVRIRVVDENGKGLAKARIFFQHWRGHIDYSEFRHVNQYADENGVWEWDEAPLDEFQADICHPNGMSLSSRPITARPEEYVFNPPPMLVVSGSVIDAKTRMPIPSFRVVSGLRDAPGLNSGEYWNRREAEQFTSGKYRVTNSREAPAHMWRIEAEGYKNAVTRDIKMDEGSITIDFELQPAADIQARILTPEGIAAAEADIAIGVARDRITIRNGKIREQETRATRLKADPDGRFRIPDLDVPFQIVILHADGYAHVKSIDGPIPETITLNAWARAEGSFRVGNQLVPDVPIGIHGAGLSSYDRENGPDVSTQTIGTTDSAGQYRFDRIVPGFYRIGREITFMVRDGATEVTSSQRVAVEYVAGKTTTLDLGGTGRAVTGKLIPPADFSDVVLWSNGQITVTPDLPQPTIPKSAPFDAESPDQEARVTAWLATDEGKAYLAAHHAYQIECEKYPEITATIARDGSFRIDDLPAGKYVLSLYLERNPSLSLPEYRITVPVVEKGAEPEPVSLGELILKKQ